MTPYSIHRKEAVSAKLYFEKAEDMVASLAPNSIDLIVTSPPYFVGKEYDVSKSWEDFRSEVLKITPLMLKALKPGGSICWQVGNHVHKGQVTPLDALIVVDMKSFPTISLRNRIIWTFGHGTHASKRFSGRHETILWYAKEKSKFNLNAFRVPQKYPGKRHYKGPKKGKLSGNPLGKNPGDVWDLGEIWKIPSVKAKHVEKTAHPCQFPTALIRRLIRGLTSENAMILDPYSGSGSAGVAALLEGRNFIGCDVSLDYIEIAKERLEATVKGKVEIREDIPVRIPNPNEKVSIRPSHFIG